MYCRMIKIKHCGRICCRCQETFYFLNLKQQLYVNLHQKYQDDFTHVIEKHVRETLGCYGSYKQMKKNLEKINT